MTKKEKKNERVTPGWTDISGPDLARFLSRNCMYHSILILHNPVQLLNIRSTNSFS